MDKKYIAQRILIAAFFVVMLGGMFLGYRYFSKPPQKEVTRQPPVQQSEPNHPDDHKIAGESAVELAPPPAVAPAVESEPIIEPETRPEESADRAPLITNRITLLSRQRRANSETFVTRDDLPEELRQKLDEAVEAYQRDGYFEITEADIENMNAPYNEVQAFALDDPALTVTAEKIEETALADMEYIGVIPDRISNAEDAPVPGIRRVFKSEAGYISLHEADLRNSEALLQKEFVNKSIKGYPATQVTYCAPSMRCVTELSWLTNDKRYELSLRGNMEDLGDDGLVKIASSLDLPPPPQTQQAE